MKARPVQKVAPQGLEIGTYTESYLTARADQRQQKLSLYAEAEVGAQGKPHMLGTCYTCKALLMHVTQLLHGGLMKHVAPRRVTLPVHVENPTIH